MERDENTAGRPGPPRTKDAEGQLDDAPLKQARLADVESLLLSYAAALEARTGAEGDVAGVALQIADMDAAWGQPEKAATWRTLRPSSRSK